MLIWKAEWQGDVGRKKESNIDLPPLVSALRRGEQPWLGQTMLGDLDLPKATHCRHLESLGVSQQTGISLSLFPASQISI